MVGARHVGAVDLLAVEKQQSHHAADLVIGTDVDAVVEHPGGDLADLQAGVFGEFAQRGLVVLDPESQNHIQVADNLASHAREGEV